MKIAFPEHHLFQLLKQFENQRLPLDLFLGNYFRLHRALGSKDRQLIATAAYGMMRWKALIDYLLPEPPNWEARYARYKNLHPLEYLREPTIPPHLRVSFPKELFSQLEKDHGFERAIQLAYDCNGEAPITARSNPIKTTRDELLDRWRERYDVTPCKHSLLGIQFKKRVPLVSFEEFKEGLFEIQDEASQIVASLVKGRPGEHILDYCAGAGGKTLGFAHTLSHKGQIYLHDVRPSALEQAKKRLRRAGIQNCQFLQSGHAHLKKLKRSMDWVLVDAPCSGTGTLRRNPDQKWKFSLPSLHRLIIEQREIFEHALTYVKPGGSIIYATCSLLKAENEEQMEHFMQKHSLKLASPPFISLPSHGEMDGFFAVHFNL